MREALETARREQGADTLILADRAVAGGIELTIATGDVNAAAVAAWRAPPREASAAGRAAGVPDGALWTHPDTVVQMQRELSALKTLIEQQLSGFAWSDYRARFPLQARLLRELERLGVNGELARGLVHGIDATQDYDTARAQMLEGLAALVTVAPDPLRDGGIAAFCGTTGVGKTTLVSKLAARHALSHGTDQVILISADEQRLGAHHQLRTLGQLLGIQVEVARDPATLFARVLESRDAVGAGRGNKLLVLIDLPGHVPDDPLFAQFARSLRAASRPVPLYLVAAATTEARALRRVAAVFAGAELAGCCLTRLDEAAALGSALGLMCDTRLPLMYVSEGPQVPDDNLRMDGAQFVRRAVDLCNQHGAVPAATVPEPLVAC
jgi:flagellar biosynthesis protein FlhF